MVENKKEPDDYSFDFEDTEKIEEIIDKKLVEDKKKHEIDIEYIKNNLPEKKSMETILKKAIVKGKDQNDVLQEKQCVVFETQLDDKDADFMEIEYDADGKPKLKNDGRKVIIYDPVFSMDLREHAEGQISDCAATTFPMIADKMVQIALDEKKLRQPEERKAIFNYWWIILLMIMIPVIIVTLMIVRGGGGGG